MKKAIFFLFIAVPTIFFLFILGQKDLKKTKDDNELMGGEKSIEEYVITNEDRNNLKLYLSTSQNYDPNFQTPIPRTLHFIWLKSSGMSKETKKCIRSFLRKHPGWTCKIWTDSLSKSPFPHCELASIQELKWAALHEEYLQANREEVKSLLLRLEILNEEGGIFIDHNLLSVQSLEPLRERYEFFMGLKPLKTPVLGSSVAPSPHVIAASKHAPIIQAQILGIKENWSDTFKAFLGNSPESEEYRKFYAVTLPMQRAVNAHVRQGRNAILPAGYFHAIGENVGLFAKANEQQMQFSHLGKFETMVMQNLIKLEKRSKQLLLSSGILFSFSLLLFVYSLVRKKYAH